MLNKIHLGDCLELMKDIPDKSIDMILTDIPYGKVSRTSNGLRNLDKGKADAIDFNLDEIIIGLCRVTKGSIYVFCAIKQVSSIRDLLIQNKMSTRLIIWEKSNPSPMNGDKIWLSGVECCVYGKFPKATFNLHCKNTVLKYPCGRSKIHPTQKPLKMFEDLILASSNEGDTILDPFIGSGTTAIACINTNRNFVGIEKDEHYFNLANERLKNTIQKDGVK